MTDKIRAGGGDDFVPLRELDPGERIRLRGDIVAEVMENPRDGMWIIVKYLSTPAGAVRGDALEMVASDDVLARETS
jgi:hypothetical protein